MTIKNCIQKEFKLLNINIHKFNYVNIVLIIIASIIASFALLTNNYQSIIASKIIGLAIIPFISLCIMIIGGTYKEIASSGLTCILFVALCLCISMIIGIFNSWSKWKPEPSPEMMNRGHFKYDNIEFEVSIAFIAGIGIYFAILKTSIIALIGLILSISVIPAICNAGLFWGMYILENEKNYITYGNHSFSIFMCNIFGMFAGFMCAFLVHCI
jgi:hypothetical protein